MLHFATSSQPHCCFQHQQRKVAPQELRFSPRQESYLPRIAAGYARLRIAHQHMWENEHPGEDPAKVESLMLDIPHWTAQCFLLIMWCSVSNGPHPHQKHLHPQAPPFPMSRITYKPPAKVCLQRLCASTTHTAQKSLAARPQCWHPLGILRDVVGTGG